MPQNCHRCGQLVTDRTVFCPSCNAPQIRVSVPQTEFVSQKKEDEGSLPNDNPAVSLEPSAVALPASATDLPSGIHLSGVQWNLFFRIASPLAALAGCLSLVLLPVGLFVLLPYAIVRAIKRYRTHHPGPLQGKHGARLGAFAALLSFLSFVLFFLATISVKRPEIISRFEEMAKQSPDPQAQQAIYWFTTNQGFTAIMGITLVIFLVIFLVVGVVSGILAATSKSQTKL